MFEGIAALFEALDRVLPVLIVLALIGLFALITGGFGLFAWLCYHLRWIP